MNFLKKKFFRVFLVLLGLLQPHPKPILLTVQVGVSRTLSKKRAFFLPKKRNPTGFELEL